MVIFHTYVTVVYQAGIPSTIWFSHGFSGSWQELPAVHCRFPMKDVRLPEASFSASWTHLLGGACCAWEPTGGRGTGRRRRGAVCCRCFVLDMKMLPFQHVESWHGLQESRFRVGDGWRWLERMRIVISPLQKATRSPLYAKETTLSTSRNSLNYLDIVSDHIWNWSDIEIIDSVFHLCLSHLKLIIVFFSIVFP